MRETIAASLRVATEHCDFFRLRRFVRTLNQPQWGRVRNFLTTNWDRNLEVELGMHAPGMVTHIHGDVGDPACLYLPSETSTESYRADWVTST